MIYSSNEWDTLREVFVGNIENPNNPMKGKDLHCINYADKDNIDYVKEGYYPKQVIEETKEDLEELVSTLKSFRVSVKRPTTQDNFKPFLSNGECRFRVLERHPLCYCAAISALSTRYTAPSPEPHAGNIIMTLMALMSKPASYRV